MEILKELLSGFKEILYDIFGYLLPGYLVLFILSTPFLISECCSPMYALLEISLKNDTHINLVNIFQDFSFLVVLIISFIAYLLGHLPIFLSSPLGTLIKKLSKLIKIKSSKSDEDTKLICSNVETILEKNPCFHKDLFNDTDNKMNKDLLKTFASTYSRFDSHNDLIQKYTCKVNFYNSLCCIFLIMFVDSFISSFIWVSINPSMYNPSVLVKLFTFDCFLFLFFLTFYCQYKRHTNLKNKECYLFLYKYFCPKTNS